MIATPKRVIFLDVDGVIKTAATYRTSSDAIDEDCVANLNQLTDDTGAKLVISSSWRIGRTLPELCELFNQRWGVKAQILDKTPILKLERGYEIARWLKERDLDSFVIIDDEADMAHLGKHLVQTSFQTGLTAEHCAKAKEHLTAWKVSEMRSLGMS